MVLKGIVGGIFTPTYAQIDLKNATIIILDGGDTNQESLEITVGEGNLTYTERVNREYTLDRGLLDEVRNGDEVPIDVSLDFVWEYIKGTAATTALPSVEDALKRINAAAAWVSSDSDACRPYSVDLKILYQPTPSACGDAEEILLEDFRYEELAHDLRAGTVAVSGRCNKKTATVTRYAQT